MAEVYIVEPLGPETLINVKVSDVVIKIRYPGEISFKPGEKIWIKFDINKLHIFDVRTEEAII